MTYLIVYYFLIMGQASYAIDPRSGFVHWILNLIVGWLIVPGKIIGKLSK